MHIWVDADACPRPVKEVLFKAAQRVQVPCTLVANQAIAVPRSALIRSIQVGQGFDVADNEIVRRCEPGDLVVTQDIPLAAEVVAKGAEAVTPRGHWLDKDTALSRDGNRWSEKLFRPGQGAVRQCTGSLVGTSPDSEVAHYPDLPPAFILAAIAANVFAGPAVLPAGVETQSFDGVPGELQSGLKIVESVVGLTGIAIVRGLGKPQVHDHGFP